MPPVSPTEAEASAPVVDAASRATEPGPAIRWDVVTELDRLETTADAWRDLCGSRQFFAGPDWTLSWLRWRAEERTPYVILGRDAAGRLAAVLPLARAADGELSTCGAEHGAAHLDVVAAPGCGRSAADGALALLAERRPPRVRFDRLAEDGALLEALRGGAVEGRRVERVATTCPYVVHEGDWDAFLGALSKHQRHELQRQCRRFWDRPGTRVRWVRSTAGCEEGIAELFELHARRFSDLDKPSAFTGDALQAFHTTLARRLAREGRLLLGFLDEGERAVASVYGFHHGAATYMFQAGIDPAYHATGAGVVLRSYVLRDEVIGARRTELDLLDGCYAWKLRWATGVRVLFDVDLYPDTIAGRARGAVAAGLASLRETAANALKGQRCPGRSDGDTLDPKHCARLGCRFDGLHAEAHGGS